MYTIDSHTICNCEHATVLVAALVDACSELDAPGEPALRAEKAYKIITTVLANHHAATRQHGKEAGYCRRCYNGEKHEDCH